MATSFKTVDSLLNQGMKCYRERHFGEAGQYFMAALDLIERQSEPSKRLDQFNELAYCCCISGYPDISLMAVQGLLASPERKENPEQHCSDLLQLARNWHALGRPDASAVVNAAALRHALEHEDFADAASASTNLAMYHANTGNLQAALRRLQQSLEYLAKEPSNPDTDVITRLDLIQVVDALHADPVIALEHAGPLFRSLRENLVPEHWELVAPAFHRLVNRYLAAHPMLNPTIWKKRNFPGAFKENAE